MRIAGLDLATQTGVCIGEPGSKPVFFARDLGKGRDHVERWGAALRLAHELIKDHGVEAIGIEASIQAKHHAKAQNDLLGGLIACVRGWAQLKNIPTATFHPATVDKRFLGYSPKTSKERKAAIWKQCEVFGWTPDTQDERDAGAVWEAMCVEVSPAYAAASGTLFRGVHQ